MAITDTYARAAGAPDGARPELRYAAMAVLLCLLLVRLGAMAWIPLNDTTEARYAEIARKMLETGNWVTLWHAYGVPFWGKPPLSTWLAAGAMGAFGINEFAIRLPSLLLAVATVWLTAKLARRQLGVPAGWAAALIASGGLLFFTAAGTVMTDPALAFALALAQAAFWRALRGDGARWGWLFFVGLGLGLLAKGPLTLVLAGLPIGAWLLWRRAWREAWRALPWVGGTLLMLAIAAPWYGLAEMRTPGFLDYFIVGEHLRRFLTPGWKGDLYGFAHASPRGMIWPYALIALLPWSLWLPAWLARRPAPARALWRDEDGWLLYAALWCLAPAVFFSVSGNVIWPYALPMAPGFALAAATLWMRGGRPRGLPALAALVGIAGVVATAMFVVRPGDIGYSQKRLVAAWRAQHPAPDSVLLFFDDRPLFSAEFYSAGRALLSPDPARLRALVDNGTTDYVAVSAAMAEHMPLRARFEEVARTENSQGPMLLLRERVN